MLFNSGYHANIGVVPALAGPTGQIFSDELNHASLIDGCRLSGAVFRIYLHKNLKRLRELLEKRSQYRRAMIVTDSVFSMDGDIAPIPELLKLADKYDAWLMIDEAQRLPELSRAVKGWYDFGLPVKIIMSGSSSLNLLDQAAESLTGRFIACPVKY